MPFNRLNHSILGEIRPRFSLKIGCNPEHALESIGKAIDKDPTISGECANSYAFVRIPKKDQHYWSPEMSVRIEEEEFSKNIEVHCLIGPKQSVWALWAFVYTTFVVLGLFGGIYGWVLYRQGDGAGWLWSIPISLLLIGTAFIAAKFGQKKGRDQMLHLVSFVYHTLNGITSVERIED